MKTKHTRVWTLIQLHKAMGGSWLRSLCNSCSSWGNMIRSGENWCCWSVRKDPQVTSAPLTVNNKAVCYLGCFRKKWSVAFSRPTLYSEQWGRFFFFSSNACMLLEAGGQPCAKVGSKSPNLDSSLKQTSGKLATGVSGSAEALFQPMLSLGSCRKRRKKDSVEPAGLHLKYSNTDIFGLSTGLSLLPYTPNNKLRLCIEWKLAS